MIDTIWALLLVIIIGGIVLCAVIFVTALSISGLVKTRAEAMKIKAEAMQIANSIERKVDP